MRNQAKAGFSFLASVRTLAMLAIPLTVSYLYNTLPLCNYQSVDKEFPF